VNYRLEKFFYSLLGEVKLYMRISPKRLIIREPKTGITFDEPPEIAIERSYIPRILGVGFAARDFAGKPSVEVTNPFAHPRSLVSDFTLGEQVLKAAIKQVLKGRLMLVRPLILLNLSDEPDGGYTQVELRALREMAVSASGGGRFATCRKDLTDQEILSDEFPV
jgi:rod shape-determining protein MreB